jgi:glycerol-3-phosphate acyltransferase PlsX
VIRIALDAMGGDNAPEVEVEGAAQAIRELPPDFTVQLVGRTADIEAALARHPEADRARFQIVDAPEVVGMGEKPLAAIKSKPRSSIMVGLGIQKAGKPTRYLGRQHRQYGRATLVRDDPVKARDGAVMPTDNGRSWCWTRARTWTATPRSWSALRTSAPCTRVTCSAAPSPPSAC